MNESWYSGYSYGQLALLGAVLGLVFIALMIWCITVYQAWRGPRKPTPRKNFRPF